VAPKNENPRTATADHTGLDLFGPARSGPFYYR